MLLKQHVDLITSYISNTMFSVKQEEEYFELKKIKVDEPQSSVLEPIRTEDTDVARFADFTALPALQDKESFVEKLHAVWE